MRADVIVLPEPLGDDHTGLVDACKPLSIQNLVPERSIEALVVAVLPGRARIDPDRLNADALKPVLKRCRRELRTIVRANVVRPAAFQQQRIERLQNVRRAHLRSNAHTQGLARIFIEHGQHLVRAPVAELVVDEVDRPDVVLVFRSQPDHRRVVMIEPLTLLVPLRKLQAFLAP